MAEQVERLQKLAVDLLDLSRLDAGSVELEREPVDLSELTREILGEFKPAVTAPRDRAGAAAPGPDQAPAATVNGWLRSCVSCSTMRSATPPRART